MQSIIITAEGQSYEAAGLVTSITWSGDYRQCARTLKFDLTASPSDKSIPVVPTPPGAMVTFRDGDREVFRGFVVSRQRSTGSNTITVTCYDHGFYLNRNQTTKQVKNQTPEQLARAICGEFGIEVGQLAATGVQITRNFSGVALYKIIQTAYTLAARQNGKAYQAIFSEGKLNVVEVEKNDETLVLEPGVNLQSATATDSIEATVTQAAIYDKNDKLVRTVKNGELQKLYGVIQQIVRQKDGGDASAEAQKLLDDNGLKQTMTVESLGNLQNMTGHTVAVYEPFTGIYGLFWIASDIHTWKGGQYYNKLTLSLKRLMDEQEAGSLPNKTGGKTKSTAKGAAINYGDTGWEAYKKRLPVYQKVTATAK